MIHLCCQNAFRPTPLRCRSHTLAGLQLHTPLQHHSSQGCLAWRSIGWLAMWLPRTPLAECFLHDSLRVAQTFGSLSYQSEHSDEVSGDVMRMPDPGLHRSCKMPACLQAAPCVLAVGHACRDVRQQGEGHIALWTMKDPLRPVNVISTPAGVTSIAWSKRTPIHVAVGLRSGIIAIYDARQQRANTLYPSAQA